MSLGDAGKNRRKQIKSLRSKRAELLNQRDLSMKGRMAVQQAAAQQAAAQQAAQNQKKIRILPSVSRIVVPMSIYKKYVKRK